MNESLLNALNNYAPSEESLEIAHNNPSLNLAGPTGAGKDTLAGYLAQIGNFSTVVSDTTRASRPGEVNGVDYHYITEEQAFENVTSGKYIEAEPVHQKYMYGTGIEAYERVAQAGRTPILVIDVKGMETLMRAIPNFETVLLLPPDFDTWQQRLDGRNAIPLEEKVRRLTTALDEIVKPVENPRFHPVVNTEVVDTAQVIISEEYKSAEYRERALRVAADLIERTKAFLSEHPAA